MKHIQGVVLASVALFVSALSAQAQIIYSGDQHIVIARTDYRIQPTSTPSDPGAFQLDLNGDGTADFSLFTHKLGPVPNSPAVFGGRGLNGSKYEGLSSLLWQAFDAGTSLGTGPQWTSGGSFTPLSSGQNWWGGSFFGDMGSGPSAVSYLGFKLSLQGSDHFGWLAYELPVGLNTSLTIDGWAYQNLAGVPIITGDVGAAATPVPEPSTYGLFGAVAVAGLAWVRRCRRAKM